MGFFRNNLIWEECCPRHRPEPTFRAAAQTWGIFSLAQRPPTDTCFSSRIHFRFDFSAAVLRVVVLFWLEIFALKTWPNISKSLVAFCERFGQGNFALKTRPNSSKSLVAFFVNDLVQTLGRVLRTIWSGNFQYFQTILKLFKSWFFKEWTILEEFPIFPNHFKAF